MKVAFQKGGEFPKYLYLTKSAFGFSDSEALRALALKEKVELVGLAVEADAKLRPLTDGELQIFHFWAAFKDGAHLTFAEA